MPKLKSKQHTPASYKRLPQACSTRVAKFPIFSNNSAKKSNEEEPWLDEWPWENLPFMTTICMNPQNLIEEEDCGKLLVHTVEYDMK